MSRPCATFDRAYQIAQGGDLVSVDSGAYPSQRIGYDPAKEAPKPVVRTYRAPSSKPAATPGAEVISGSKTDRVKFDANGTTKDN